jgi:predicted metal-dependent peptidase
VPGASGQHEHRGRRAVQRLVEYAPASGSLALWVAHRDVTEDEALAHEAGRLPAWTDGRCIHYTPAFDDLGLEAQTGWVAHELLHIALRHGPRFRALQRRLGDVDLALFNRCADAIVNSALAPAAWLKLPAQALTLPVLLDQVLGTTRSDEAALLEWDVERLYAAVDDRQRQEEPDERRSRGREGGGHGGRRDGPRAATLRTLGGRDSEDLKPAPEGADAVVAEAEQAREWGDRLLRGHSGDGAFSILRSLPRDLPQVHTPWEQVLRTQVARALAPRLAENPSRPARSWLANQGRVGRPARGRLPWAPGLTHTKRVPRLVLVLDVSGSIDEPLLARFAAELAALTRRLDTAVTVVVGDDAVRSVHRLAPGRVGVKDLLAWAAVPGAGNTDFTPLLEEATRHHPDLTVVLTDLEGPARHRPPGVLLWAVPPGADEAAVAAAPFGRVLRLR